MRRRSSGSCVNRTSFWMSRLPSSSAGCDLPAITIWMGRFLWVSSDASRSSSSSMSVSRLYVGTRRANPIVSTSGSSRSSNQAGAVAPGFSSCQAAVTRRRASATRFARIRFRTSHSSASETPGPDHSAAVVSEVPSRSCASESSSGSVQVGAWTPLVTEVIGTSAASKPGQRPLNMPRLTSPCSWETPFACWPSRRPITAMLNTSPEPPG